MAHLKLNDLELGEMILQIILPGKVSEFLDFMETVPGAMDRETKFLDKRLAFGDFDIQIYSLRHNGNSIMEATIEFLQPDRTFGFLATNKLVKFLIATISERYGKNGPYPGISCNAFMFGDVLAGGGEFRISHHKSALYSDRKSDHDRDIVAVRFNRKFDK